MFPFMRNESGFTTIINGESFNVSVNNPKYKELLACVKIEDADGFLSMVNVAAAIQSYKSNAFKVEIFDDELRMNGKPVHSTLSKRIMEFVKEELPIEYMLKFMDKLYQNPSRTAIDELFDFMSHEHLPVCDDGDFLAYKVVDSNFWSKRGGDIELISGKADENGKIFNGVGEIIECRRSSVDDDRSNKCSNGLHIGGLKYSGPGGTYFKSGNQVIIVKVNPKDVVSVPKDYDAQKARVCRYEVYSVFKQALPSTLEYTNESNSHEYDSYNYDDDWFDSDYDDYTECAGCEECQPEPYKYRADQVIVGDYIRFTYKDKIRAMSVEEIDDKFISGTLTDSDPSYSEITEKSNYRRFYKNLITELYIA